MNEELLDHVGPGWQQLAADLCEQVSAAGFVADEIVSLNGSLRACWHDPHLVGAADARPVVAVLLLMAAEKLARDSLSVCEGCGDPGDLVKRADGYYGTQLKTLCPQCACGWSASCFSQWSEITGRLDPLDQLIADTTDDIDPDDDTDEDRGEPTRIPPRPNDLYG